MRDIVLVLFFAVVILLSIGRPDRGILVWSWISYMNPHRLSWGFAYSLPLAMVTALVTIGSLLINRERKVFPINAITVLWMIFIVFIMLSTLVAYVPDLAFPQMIKVLKIQLIVILTMVVMQSRERLHAMVWVICLSIGFYGVKGGIFAIATAGGHRVWGPPDSYIEGNNELAVALLMILPLMWYLRKHTSSKLIRLGLLGAMLLCAASSIASYSRGALLATLAMLFMLWWKSGRSPLQAVLFGAFLGTVLAVMPAEYHARMSTIQTYEEDGSAMSRINAWLTATNVANHNLMGGGFEALWQPHIVKVYAPDPDTVQDAHSIYFEVLGELGWPGLLVFLSIGLLGWLSAGRIATQCKDNPEWQWAGDLAAMLQVSLTAYAAGGAFLGLAYYDLPWNMLAIIVILRLMVERGSQNLVDGPSPVPERWLSMWRPRKEATASPEDGTVPQPQRGTGGKRQIGSRGGIPQDPAGRPAGRNVIGRKRP